MSAGGCWAATGRAGGRRTTQMNRTPGSLDGGAATNARARCTMHTVELRARPAQVSLGREPLPPPPRAHAWRAVLSHLPAGVSRANENRSSSRPPSGCSNAFMRSERAIASCATPSRLRLLRKLRLWPSRRGTRLSRHRREQVHVAAPERRVRRMERPGHGGDLGDGQRTGRGRVRSDGAPQRGAVEGRPKVEADELAGGGHAGVCPARGGDPRLRRGLQRQACERCLQGRLHRHCTRWLPLVAAIGARDAGEAHAVTVTSRRLRRGARGRGARERVSEATPCTHLKAVPQYLSSATYVNLPRSDAAAGGDSSCTVREPCSRRSCGTASPRASGASAATHAERKRLTTAQSRVSSCARHSNGDSSCRLTAVPQPSSCDSAAASSSARRSLRAQPPCSLPRSSSRCSSASIGARHTLRVCGAAAISDMDTNEVPT